MKKNDWEEKYKEKLKERKKDFQTTSNIKIKRFYTQEDISGNLDEKNSMPGEFPFTRGVQPTMYRGRFWTMRQYAGFGSAKETNERFKYLLDKTRNKSNFEKGVHPLRKSAVLEAERSDLACEGCVEWQPPAMK